MNSENWFDFMFYNTPSNIVDGVELYLHKRDKNILPIELQFPELMNDMKYLGYDIIQGRKRTRRFKKLRYLYDPLNNNIPY